MDVATARQSPARILPDARLDNRGTGKSDETEMTGLLDDTAPSLLVVEEPFSDDVSDTVCRLLFPSKAE